LLQKEARELLEIVNKKRKTVYRKIIDLTPNVAYPILMATFEKGTYGDKVRLLCSDPGNDSDIDFYTNIGDDYGEFFKNPTYIQAIERGTFKLTLTFYCTMGEKHIYSVNLANEEQDQIGRSTPETCREPPICETPKRPRRRAFTTTDYSVSELTLESDIPNL